MNTLSDTEAKRRSRINNTRLVDEQDGTIFEDRAMTFQTTMKTLFKSALTKLQKFFRTIQRRFSVDAMQKQTDNMLKGYRVDQAVVPNVLHSYSYKAWADEVKRIHHGNNEKTDIAIISLLTFRYGDAQLRRMLMEVGDVPWKKQIDRLKNAQIDYWVKTGKSPRYVAQWLTFSGTIAEIAANPSVNSWFAYVAKRGKNESPADLLVEALNL